jgi:hypothetical protein
MAEQFRLSELGAIKMLATLLTISPRQKLQESVSHVKFNTDSEVFWSLAFSLLPRPRKHGSTPSYEGIIPGFCSVS